MLALWLRSGRSACFTGASITVRRIGAAKTVVRGRWLDRDRSRGRARSVIAGASGRNNTIAQMVSFVIDQLVKDHSSAAMSTMITIAKP
jgi:hypothetical protein